MDEEEQPQKPPPKINDPSIVLFLGLYLILLAFFILLSTISSLSQSKSAAAVGSLNSTFRSDPRVAALTGSSILIARSAGELDHSVLIAIRATFTATPLGISVNETTIGNAVRFVVPAETIFRPGSSVVQAEAGELFAKLSQALESNVIGFRNEVEIEVRTGDELSVAGPELTLLVNRAGVLARGMVEHKVPARSIQTGLRAGTPDTIAFFFRQRDESAPTITFAGQPVFEDRAVE